MDVDTSVCWTYPMVIRDHQRFLRNSVRYSDMRGGKLLDPTRLSLPH